MDTSTFYGSAKHRTFTLGDSPKKALLLHGFPGTPAELRPLAEVLHSGGWQATAPLLPGFSVQIARLGERRWQDWQGAALTHWQEVKREAQQTLLVGFSMGAALALHLAAAQPPDKLVLIAPFWRMNDWRTHLLPVAKYVMPTLRPFENADFGDKDVRKRFEVMLPNADLDDPNIQARLRQEVILPTSSVNELRKLGRSAYSVARRVGAPTLILQGFQDTTVRPIDTRTLLTRLSGPVTLREFSGGHDIVKPHSEGHETLLTLLKSL